MVQKEEEKEWTSGEDFRTAKKEEREKEWGDYRVCQSTRRTVTATDKEVQATKR